MKKCLFLLVISIFVLTGCGSKTITCTNIEESNDYKLETEVKAKLKGNKISSASSTMIFGKVEESTAICNLYESLNQYVKNEEDKLDYSCDDKRITLNNYLNIISIDDNDSKKEYTKDEFFKYMEEQKFTCK